MNNWNIVAKIVQISLHRNFLWLIYLEMKFKFKSENDKFLEIRKNWNINK